MTTQAPAATQLVEEVSVRPNSQEISERVSELYDLIARRAFEIFESRGATPGREQEDWTRAESELLHPLLVTLAETPEAFLVAAEVPGFGAKDIEISVEPQRFVLFGERRARLPEKDVQIIYSEAIATHVLRSLDLPSEVDAKRTSTALEDGVLTVYLPKARNGV